MRWCVIFNQDLDSTAVIAEDSLEHYRHRGYRRISEWSVNADDLKAAVARGEIVLDPSKDLDDPAPAKKAAAKQDKESN